MNADTALEYGIFYIFAEWSLQFSPVPESENINVLLSFFI